MRMIANFTGLTALCMALAVVGVTHWPREATRTAPSASIVGVPAGLSTGIIARLLASKAGDILKQSFVVDNRPGAGGIISQEAAKSAPPDGYTLVMATGSTMVIYPAL